MENTGSAMMGIGRASGEERAIEAARAAINSPLLELSIDGARGVLFNVCGGPDLTMTEINEAAKVITESIDPEAKVIFGAVTDESIKKGEIKVTVIATGFNNEPFHKRKVDGIDEAAEVDSSKKQIKKKKEAVTTVPVEEEKDEWDIPAFIRRKIK